MESTTDISEIMYCLRSWEEEHQNSLYDPVPVLTRIAEIIEVETDNYMKMDPDPFDERHPIRADPDCALGHILKVLFRKENFMNKLVNDYLRDNYYPRMPNSSKDSRKLNIAACRLMLDIMPGLDTAVVFQLPEMEATILRLFTWAEKAVEPLQSYAIGLLASSMEVQDIAANFREQNAKLVPLMLKELHKLQSRAAEERSQGGPLTRPFAHLGPTVDFDTEMRRVPARSRRKRGNDSKENGDKSGSEPQNHISPLQSPPHPVENMDTFCGDRLNGVATDLLKRVDRKRSSDSDDDSSELSHKQLVNNQECGENSVMSPPLTTPARSASTTNTPANTSASEHSNSSWAEMESYVIGNMQMYPPTLSTRQILILRYLTPMGEYQEFLGHVFEHNALELVLKYTNVRETKDSRLAFEALKYLAALLCHKKFSIEFINMRGLQALLEVPRPSVAATGVSICLYYLAYCEDAMERVCQLPHHLISELVRYSLWLLECSHDSGRCHATMFFGLSFQFRVILMEFDAQDGLRKLYNLISTQPILSVEEETTLNEDEENSARQIVRHVCVALKRYLEAHLCIKAESVRRNQLRESGGQMELGQLPAKLKTNPEEVKEQVQLLFENMPFRAHWEPVEELIRLGGITLLLQIIAFAYEWNSSGGRAASGTAEMVRSALDSLAICSVMPRVQVMLGDRVDLPDDTITVGTNIILGAAEGEIVVDAEVQKAALKLIVNCVCAPIHRVGGNIARYSVSGSGKKKTNYRTSEELIAKVWESVRSNNGIMVLLQLMMVKTPITDADSIRALACQALAGLARSETVRQIVGKLPLFTNGQLQLLMRDPILQDKRQEHFIFQKYALELMERVSGKAKPSGTELEISLANMHRASVVAQTRIQYNDKQLYQLIHQHLLSRGLTDSAAILHREANLPGAPLKIGPSSNFPPNPYRVCSTPPGPLRPRLSSFSPGVSVSHHRSQSTPTSAASSSKSSIPPCQNSLVTQPIKLNLASTRKSDKSELGNIVNTSTPNTTRSLQKQISYEQSAVVAANQLLKNNSGTLPEPSITLDSIITEYLTNQHALCKNPMVPCPQFNLFVPHKCPDPKAKNSAPTNFTSRVLRRTLGIGCLENMRLDKRLAHSRFCPVRTFRMGDEDGYFTCCAFCPTEQFVLVGTHHGEVQMYNLHTGVEEITFQVHESYVSHMQFNKEGSLLLTSSQWQRPLSAVWNVKKFFDKKFALPEEDYVEFSKFVQDRIIGTRNHIATIYDVATGKKIQTLTPQISNQYTKNKATFSPTDELVLSDGVLWDVTSGKEIHKFDKLNQNLSGVFHPNGLEVVCNTEVWDLRTFHLLRTVSVLDQCEINFTRDGSIIYTRLLEQETEDDLPYDSSFKTLDAFDYSCIATIDVKKNVYDLACNKSGTQIAIVENQGVLDSVEESFVRVYDVGRRRDDEDEAANVEEEEEEDELDGSDDGSASQSGSDDEQQDGNGGAAGGGGGNGGGGGGAAPAGGAGENNGNDGDNGNENNAEGGASDSDDELILTLSDSPDTDDLDEIWFP
ncbi:DDB1- and CUL4-associated factor 1-like [Schistocerca gregaria]|uniref:DDB1- and CUL4-associated factor 1-like n=1 Tax=Schistocerca gregaria TaxID=7010 RepID=UPI00211DB80C|nr:DDB1- and CUL4-associated factor 1-like [Schistocerca gregaria]